MNDGLDKEMQAELLRKGAEQELPRAIERVNVLQRILGVKARQVKASLSTVTASTKGSSWTPKMRKAAAERMKQYWANVKASEEEQADGRKRKAS